MCWPLIIQAVGTAVAVGGAIKGGRDAKKAAKTDAAASEAQAIHARVVSEFNAAQMRREAEQIRKAAGLTLIKGGEEENKIRQSAAQVIGSQKAAFGAGNIIANMGTPAALQLSAKRIGEIDALRIRSNYQNEAAALQFQASATDEQANITLVEGDAAYTAGMNNAQASRTAGKNAYAAGLINATAIGANAAVNNKWV